MARKLILLFVFIIFFSATVYLPSGRKVEPEASGACSSKWRRSKWSTINECDVDI